MDADKPQVETRHGTKSKVLALVGVSLLCAALPVAVARWKDYRQRTNMVKTSYEFPTPELAALDRVVQARFAVVPDKDFGVSRISPLHELFVPKTPDEKAVIATLRQRRQDVAFYVVSRRIFRKEVGPAGHYPVQGPVYMTGLSLPFATRKSPDGYAGVEQDVAAATRHEPPQEAVEYDAKGNRPHGLSPKVGLPEGWRLVKLAAPVFEVASRTSSSVAVGANLTLGRWQIAAVPIRASHEACVQCHNGWSQQHLPSKSGEYISPIALGDPVGIAVYAIAPKPLAKPAPGGKTTR